MLIPVHPHDLHHTMVHCYDPSAVSPPGQRCERSGQWHGEFTLHLIPASPLSHGAVWDIDHHSATNTRARVHVHDLKHNNIWPAARTLHLCTWHLSTRALFSLLHCPHWLRVLSTLTKPVVPVALISPGIINAFPFKCRQDVLHGEFSS